MEKETPQSPSLEALRKVIEAADTSRVTKDDFTALAKQIIEIVKADKAKSDEKRAELAQQVQSSLSALEARLNADLSEIKASVQSFSENYANKIRFEHESFLAEAQAKLDAVRDGEDADEEVIVDKVLAKLPPPAELKPETPESIRAKAIASKLNINELDGLDALYEKIRGMMPTRSLGASVIHKFMDDDVLVGTKNGSNTTFTLAKAPINGSLHLYKGGVRMRPTEDYTLAGKTVTFIIPPESGEILVADYRYF